MIIILDVNIISQCTIQLYSHTLHVVYTVLLLLVGMYIAARTYIQYMCTVCVYWILICSFLLLYYVRNVVRNSKGLIVIIALLEANHHHDP